MKNEHKLQEWKPPFNGGRELWNVIQDNFYPVAMTIAGSDSGGGAGIQADLRTFAAFGVFGCSAVTALTAQNPLRVSGIMPVSPGNVKAQIEAVLSEFEVKAIKTGMLFSREIIETVADCLVEFKGAVIVDPVMVSTSGSRLLRDDAVETLMKRLLPLATVVTPNLFEAEILAGQTIATEEDTKFAAEFCRRRFGCGIIIKGGHSPDAEEASDYVLLEDGAFTLSTKRLPLPELTTHGTGCTFSAAIAAGIANGLPLKEAVAGAKHFVQTSLEHNVRTGKRFRSMFPAGFVKKENTDVLEP